MADLVACCAEGACCCITGGPGKPCGCAHRDQKAWNQHYDIAYEHGRADEREAILSPEGWDDPHPDGSIGPDEAPPYGGDAAYWYRRWLFLARRLDEEAAERIANYANFNEKLAGVVRDTENEACARLAEQHHAISSGCPCEPRHLPESDWDDEYGPHMGVPVADLIRALARTR